VAEECVANVMATDVAVCHPGDSVLAALELLVDQRLSGREHALTTDWPLPGTDS